MANSTASLASLAATIAETASGLAAQLSNNGHPAPSFAEDGLVDYPKTPEVMGARMQLLDAVTDMYRLAMGPTDMAFMNPIFVSENPQPRTVMRSGWLICV